MLLERAVAAEVVVVTVSIQDVVDVGHLEAEALESWPDVVDRVRSDAGVDERQIAAPNHVEHHEPVREERRLNLPDPIVDLNDGASHAVLRDPVFDSRSAAAK